MSVTRTKNLEYRILGNLETTPLTVTFNDNGEVVLSKPNGDEFTISLTGLFGKLPKWLKLQIVETDDEVYYKAAVWGYYIETGFNFNKYPNKLKWFIRGKLPAPVTFTLPLKGGKRFKFRGMEVFSLFDDEEDPETGEPLGRYFKIDFRDIKDYVTLDAKKGTITFSLPKTFDIDPVIVAGGIKYISRFSMHNLFLFKGYWYYFHVDTNKDLYVYYIADSDKDTGTWTKQLIQTGFSYKMFMAYAQPYEFGFDDNYIYGVGLYDGYYDGYRLIALSQNADGSLSIVKLHKDWRSTYSSDSYVTVRLYVYDNGKLIVGVWDKARDVAYVKIWEFDGSTFSNISYQDMGEPDYVSVVVVGAIPGKLEAIMFTENTHLKGTAVARYSYDLSTGEWTYKDTGGKMGSGEVEDVSRIHARCAGGYMYVGYRPASPSNEYHYYFIDPDDNLSDISTAYTTASGDYIVGIIKPESSGVYGIGNRSSDGTVYKVEGSLGVAADLTQTSLGTHDTYDYRYSCIGFNESTGEALFSHTNTDGDLVFETWTYKTVSAVEEVSVEDVLSVSDGLRGSLGVGLTDSVGMVDNKSDYPTQYTADAVSLADVLGLTRLATVGVVDTVGLSAALIGGTTGVLSDVTTLSGLAYQVARGRVYDAFTPADTVILSPKMTVSDAVTLADGLGLSAAARVLELLALSGTTTANPAGGLSDHVTVTAEHITAAYSIITDAVTLSDVVTAVEQILIQSQVIADSLGLSADVRANVAAAVGDLILALDKLKAAVDALNTDLFTLVDTVTASKIVNVITEAVADAINMVDGLTVNAVSVELSALLLKTKLWENSDKVLADSVGVVAEESISAALGMIDAVGLPDDLTVTPRAVVAEIIPLLDDVISHYINAIAVLTDAVGLSDVIGGSVAGLSLSDVVTLTDDVELYKWLFVREVLRLYSRITAILTANSALNALDAHKSIIDAVVSAESGVDTVVRLRSILKEKFGE